MSRKRIMATEYCENPEIERTEKKVGMVDTDERPSFLGRKENATDEKEAAFSVEQGREELVGNLIKKGELSEMTKELLEKEEVTAGEEIKTKTPDEVVANEQEAEVLDERILGDAEEATVMDEKSDNTAEVLAAEREILIGVAKREATAEAEMGAEMELWVLPGEVVADGFQDKYFILDREGDPIEMSGSNNYCRVFDSTVRAIKDAMAQASYFSSDVCAARKMYEALAADERLAAVSEVHVIERGYRQISDFRGLATGKPVKIGRTLIAEAERLLERERLARTVADIIVRTEDGMEHYFDPRQTLEIATVVEMLKSKFDEGCRVLR